jgi:hypothetical protein
MKKIPCSSFAVDFEVDTVTLRLVDGGAGGYKPFHVSNAGNGQKYAEVRDHNRGEFTYTTRDPGAKGGGPRETQGSINLGGSGRPGGPSNYQQQPVRDQVIESPNTAGQGGGTSTYHTGW